MKALEFETTLGADAKLTVPENLAGQIPKQESVRVIVLLPEGGDADWQHLTAERFFASYSEGDSIYDAV